MLRNSNCQLLEHCQLLVHLPYVKGIKYISQSVNFVVLHRGIAGSFPILPVDCTLYRPFSRETVNLCGQKRLKNLLMTYGAVLLRRPSLAVLTSADLLQFRVMPLELVLELF